MDAAEHPGLVLEPLGVKRGPRNGDSDLSQVSAVSQNLSHSGVTDLCLIYLQNQVARSQLVVDTHRVHDPVYRARVSDECEATSSPWLLVDQHRHFGYRHTW